MGGGSGRRKWEEELEVRKVGGMREESLKREQQRDWEEEVNTEVG